MSDICYQCGSKECCHAGHEDWRERAEQAEARVEELEETMVDEDTWITRVLRDFNIQYDDHRIGKRTALVEYMTMLKRKMEWK